MADNLATIDGKVAMFCVGDRDAAWHRLGQRTGEACTWKEARNLASLDWPIVLTDMYTRLVDALGMPTKTVVKVDGYKEVWRAGNDPRQLGVVGADWTPIQIDAAFDWMDSMLQAHNGAHYESAGALGNGEKIWVMARVPQTDIVIRGTDDVSKGYLLATTGMAGNASFIGKQCKKRVVCDNTLTIALGEDCGTMLKIRHTKNANQRLEMAKRLSPALIADSKALEDKLNILAIRKMTKDTMLTVLNRLWPENPNKDVENARNGRRDAVLAKVLELFESNDGNKIPEIRGSAYNLLNAVTEYTDHYRPVRQTSTVKGLSDDVIRAQNAVFGAGDTLKTAALDVILECTAQNPTREIRTSYAPLPSDMSTGSLLDAVLANH